tara:strand:- start:2060 stop:2530 length:471 start_codon:yes stop_codon:yes gene_type:complete
MQAKMKTFHVSYTSEMDDRTYEGTFTTKKMTIGDVSAVGVLKAQMAQGLPHDELTGRGVDRTTGMIHEMMAHCNIALTQKPEWFVPEDFIDAGLLEVVYKEVLEFENSFRPRGSKESESDGRSETASSEESEREGGTPSSNQDLVDKKVPKITQIG